MTFDSGLYRELTDLTRPLNSATQCLAYAESIPLQLVSKSTLQHLDDVIYRLSRRSYIRDTKQFRFSPDNIVSILDAGVDIPTSIACFCDNWKFWSHINEGVFPRLFPTPTSNLSPFFRLLRNHRAWRFWELCALWNARNFHNPTTTITFPNFFHGRAGFVLCKMKDQPYHLLAGPVWFDPDEMHSSQHSTNIDLVKLCDEYVDCINSTHSAANLQKELTVIQNEHYALSTAGRLKRTATMRKGITFADAQLRASNAAKILTCFLSSDLLSKLNDRSEIADLITPASFLMQHQALHSIFVPKKNKKPAPLTVSSVVRVSDGTTYTIQLAKRKLTIKNTGDLDEKRNLQFLISQGSSFQLQKLYSRFLDQKFTAKSAYFLELQKSFEQWLNDHFGALIGKSEPTAARTDLSTRVARTLCYVSSSDDCALYEADYSGNHPVLVDVTAFTSRTNDAVNRRDIIADHMKFIGADPEARKNSISYRSFDQDQRQYIPDIAAARAAGELTISYPTAMQSLESAKSVVAFPIRIFNRHLGVLEFINYAANSFDPLELERLEQLAVTVGQPYFAKRLFSSLAHAGAVAFDQNVNEQDKYFRVCETLMNVMLFPNILMFLNDPETPGRYKYVASVNRPDINASVANDEVPYFDIDVEYDGIYHLASEQCRVGGELVKTQKITKSPTWMAWLSKGSVDWKKKQLDKEIVTIRIGSEGAAVGLISCILPFNVKYDRRWDEIAKYVGANLLEYISAIKLIHTEAWRHQKTITHDVKQLVRTAYATAQDTLVAWEPLNVNRSLERPDITSSLKNLTNMTQLAMRYLDIYMDVLNSEIETGPDDLRLLLFRRLTDEDRDPKTGYVVGPNMNLRDLFDDVFQARNRDYAKKDVNVRWMSDYDFPYIKMHEVSLRAVMSNLADNAIKYSPTSGHVSLRVEEDADYLIFTISNVGGRATTSDIATAFQEGRRGLAALKKRTEGFGLGLSFVREILQLYGVSIEYSIRDIAKEERFGGGASENCWHDFELTFPPNLLLRRA